MNEADRLKLPTVEELAEAAWVGHLDDRVERYLPDSLYRSKAKAPSKDGHSRNGAVDGAAERSLKRRAERNTKGAGTISRDSDSHAK